jgi:hypothetical protein
MSLHIFYVVIYAFIFYFAYRSHSKLKYVFEFKIWFALYKHI